jgi:uncharacterized NAD-dependent epimerase/dehydratase family protein
MPRIVILTEGRSNPSDAKTACGVLRYRGHDVVAVLDSTRAGKTCGEVLGVGGKTPFIARLADAKADTLLIGIAPAGGGLPASWRPVLKEAIERRLTIISGLHTPIGEDEELGGLARKLGVAIHDVRQSPPDVTVSKNVAKDIPAFRIHTVGNDCNVGKMHSALELDKGLRERGRNSVFVPTGQTGIMIAGWGIAVDRVVSDFVAGATERMMLEKQDAEFLIVEGQGSLLHPLYSGVTLGLLHGCAPQAMVMCYEAGRTKMRHVDVGFPPMEELIRIYETMAGLICPSKVIAVSVNSSALSPEAARRELEALEARLGLPVTDPVRCGPEKLVDAALKAERELGGR